MERKGATDRPHPPASPHALSSHQARGPEERPRLARAADRLRRVAPGHPRGRLRRREPRPRGPHLRREQVAPRRRGHQRHHANKTEQQL